MNIQPIIEAGKKVPWKKVVAAIPATYAAAKELYEEYKKWREKSPGKDVNERLKSLEEENSKHSKLALEGYAEVQAIRDEISSLKLKQNVTFALLVILIGFLVFNLF